ncbi:MAG: hypothetical protein ASARMPREDX12_002702 [Alectoria sarmentosa]|nr:MAG: hypothetical protein ASARMPREDX12_002702 [Alectoria sarmentosa]
MGLIMGLKSVTPLQIINVNNTIPDSFRLNNVSLTAPSLPPSIEISIDHDFKKKLLALGMYLTAIDVMSAIGRTDWYNRPIGPEGYRAYAVGQGVWREGYDVEIDIKNSQKPGDPLQLRTCDVVTGLWQLMVQVANDNLYYEAVLTLKQHYRAIGTVTIKELKLAATANNTNADATLVSTSALPANADLALTQAFPKNLTVGTPYPTGRIVDPRDRRFSIMYTYTGNQIKSRDVFMAILGLLAEAAQYTPGAPLQMMQQVSPSKRCVITVRSFPVPYKVTYGFAAHGLRPLIYWIMLPLEKFEEMTFVLEYDGYRLAEGHIKPLTPAPGVAVDEE